MRIKRIALVAMTSATLLAGCTQLVLVEPGKREIDGAYTVQPDVSWSQREANNVIQWTIDGVQLQMMVFSEGVKDGENLYRKTGSDDGPDAAFKNMPKFRKSMTPPEIGEMFLATITQAGSSDATMKRIEPHSFGGRKGFRMEFTYATKAGLKKKGLLRGTVTGGQLYVIVYTAADIYYYDRDLPHAQAIMNSVSFLAPPSA